MYHSSKGDTESLPDAGVNTSVKLSQEGGDGEGDVETNEGETSVHEYLPMSTGAKFPNRTK